MKLKTCFQHFKWKFLTFDPLIQIGVTHFIYANPPSTKTAKIFLLYKERLSSTKQMNRNQQFLFSIVFVYEKAF